VAEEEASRVRGPELDRGGAPRAHPWRRFFLVEPVQDRVFGRTGHAARAMCRSDGNASGLYGKSFDPVEAEPGRGFYGVEAGAMMANATSNSAADIGLPVARANAASTSWAMRGGRTRAAGRGRAAASPPHDSTALSTWVIGTAPPGGSTSMSQKASAACRAVRGPRADAAATALPQRVQRDGRTCGRRDAAHLPGREAARSGACASDHLWANQVHLGLQQRMRSLAMQAPGRAAGPPSGLQRR
jgi:hypothetical protein